MKSDAYIDNLNASVKRIWQNFFARGVDYAANWTRVISLVYIANFYYTALRDYAKATAICDAVIYFPEGRLKPHGKTNLSFYERAFPIFITNELSAIFDDNFRTVLGFIALRLCIVDSVKGNSAVLIRICPAQYLMYLKIQCKR